MKCSMCMWMGLPNEAEGSIYDLTPSGINRATEMSDEAVAVWRGDSLCYLHLIERVRDFIGKKPAQGKAQ